MVMKKKPILLALDYDNTLVSHLSDRIICIQHLLEPENPESLDIPTHLYETFKTHGWEKFARCCYDHLHEIGVTQDAIEKALRAVPITNGMKQLLHWVKENDGDVIVISDSNLVNVEQGLIGNEVRQYVDEIFTNFSGFDEHGKLQISPVQSKNICKSGGRRNCKGQTLQNFVQKQSEENGITYGKVAYVGDGKNDVCAADKCGTELSGLVFPRQNFQLANILRKQNVANSSEHIFEWKNGDDILNVLLNRL